ncbi:hypothetical protein [Defluviimonas sp. WL0075]|uniref:Uncharacterized protein n=1 Tax=Albidovulum sediminicola TaxID=2984331 RepID=A0ABT2YWD5_9RHOB|nr:hypothetical protein [Defluviimonas sp. WL0075]MCV2863187.1 hypothetical protein [Defluviimonas sp. WL0075]
MRILSARIVHARRVPASDRIEALVRLLSEPRPGADIERVEVAVTAPARARDAAPLRARLLAAAKLAYAIDPGLYRSPCRASRAA